MKNIVAETKNALGLVLGAGLIARLGLLLYGRWQDQHMVVKYTDIDYHVFTDAAEYVTKGESPYNRPTYRYTPLLAWLLTPNITLCTEFGKIIFIVCDVLAGYLLYRILRLRSCPTSLATGCAALWLLNPLPATVSSRGNAESLIAVLVLGTLYCIATSGSLNLCIAGLLFGMSVHVKIYPVTYALPIYLMLNGDYSGDRERRTFLGADILPNKARMVFVIASAFSFICLTSLCFFWYSWEFLEETYFYHVTRTDTKHNFSIYFYLLYLTAETQYSWLISLTAFLPQAFVNVLVIQATLLVLCSWFYHRDLPFCCFVNTFVFVTFNKVCTSQYFLWYLSLLPLVVPSLELGVLQGTSMLVAWFAGQGLWLTPAYYLEFEGRDTLLWVWAASLVFFIINCVLLWKLIRCYRHTPLFHRGQLASIAGEQLARRPLRNAIKKAL